MKRKKSNVLKKKVQKEISKILIDSPNYKMKKKNKLKKNVRDKILKKKQEILCFGQYDRKIRNPLMSTVYTFQTSNSIFHDDFKKFAGENSFLFDIFRSWIVHNISRNKSKSKLELTNKLKKLLAFGIKKKSLKREVDDLRGAYIKCRNNIIQDSFKNVVWDNVVFSNTNVIISKLIEKSCSSVINRFNKKIKDPNKKSSVNDIITSYENRTGIFSNQKEIESLTELASSFEKCNILFIIKSDAFFS